jgi:hypothetical protein
MAGLGASVVVAAALASATVFTVSLTPADVGPSHVAAAVESSVPLDRPSAPVRVQVRGVGIDLPVISSERNLPGNPKGYPLCDVAQYWTQFDLPGAPGTTWLLGHAQPGMFLPLFTVSEQTEGEGLLGELVELQLRDGRLLTYRIDEVRERSRNTRIASIEGRGPHRLVLQTSTGPPGTVPKLQAGARLVKAERTREKAPRPQPRPCSQPAQNGSGSSNGTANGNGDTEGVADAPTDGSPSAIALLGGAVAVLLGATLFAVYLVRRGP